MPQAGKSGAGPKVQVRSTSEARRPHLYQQECTGQKILSLHRRKFRETCHFWVLPYHWEKSGKVAILEFCFLLRRKFRWKCHFRVLASHSEDNSGKNALSEFCFYSEEKSGKNAIQCFASYSEENSGKNAISDFCFLLRRKFRGKCHFKVLLLHWRKKIRGKCHSVFSFSYTEENSGKNAISKFSFYTEENSGENALSEFSFFHWRKFREKCQFRV